MLSNLMVVRGSYRGSICRNVRVMVGKNQRVRTIGSKGEHSFKLLGLIDPNKVCEASPWAKRFIESLERRR
ncbi:MULTISPECIES: hypothetical protein [Pseudomonas]|uniref:hypothetical protein n=1 Tax=Pseudomonas TaxID=286 RepID=UPI001939CC78|nr:MULTISPECIES: hypothetical protein [Pseudomonas]